MINKILSFKVDKDGLNEYFNSESNKGFWCSITNLDNENYMINVYLVERGE